jgi:hypothetical protein
MAWVPLGPGLSFKPIAFRPGDHRQLLLRLDPGTVIPPHRHHGDVHAFNVAGSRHIIGTEVVLGPHAYLYEPVGNVDSWEAVGDDPCVVHIAVTGRMDFLGPDGEVVASDGSATLQRTYLDWCAAEGRSPHAALAHPVR